MLFLGHAGAPGAASEADPEAYGVYEAVFRQAPKTDRRLVILGETVTYPRCMPSGAALEEKGWAEALANYQVQNKTPRTLGRSFDLREPYVLLSSAEWQSLFPTSSPANWRPFWKRFGAGGGYTRLSAVGFDEGRNRAVLYTDALCGPRCGSGGYKLFTKYGGRWRSTIVNADLCDWMS
jgi:hypothetical protein